MGRRVGRIVHWGKYYPPERGGIESVTAALARHFAARESADVEVVVFTAAAKPDLRPPGDGEDAVHVRRYRAFATVSSQPLSLRYVLACVASGLRATVVHLHYPNLLAALAALLLPPRVRLVVHWHSDIVGKGGILADAARWVERLMLRRAEVVVTTSPTYAESSHSLQPVIGKVCSIPLGIRLEVDGGEMEAEDVVHLDRFIGHRHCVLFVGRLVGYKGVSLLIDAMARLPVEACACIVGDGPLRDEIQQQIEHAGVSDRVLLMGSVSDATLRHLYVRASVFCLPSINRAEAFGVVLLEAMRAGLPLVTFRLDGSGVPWVNQDGVTGIVVDQVVPGALADALELVLSDAPLRARLAAGARARIQQVFAEPVILDEWERLYDRVVQRVVTLPRGGRSNGL